MTLWIAVPEDEQGVWFDDPIGADSKAEVKKLATEQWSGKLSADIDVVIYRCEHVDVLNLPKEEEEDAAPSGELARCTDTPDMFSQTEAPKGEEP